MGHRSAPKTTQFKDVAFRYSDYDVPFWARANTRPARWHRVGDGPTQYLSLSSDGAWADLIRREGLASEAEVALIRMPLWVARIELQRIVDYRDFALAEEAGFSAEALVDESHSRCQAEGARLRALGYQGILTPSVALPGELSLTLFGGRLSISWDTEPALTAAVPSKVVTVGAPPHGLVEQVRQHGQRHADYQKFTASRQEGTKRPQE